MIFWVLPFTFFILAGQYLGRSLRTVEIGLSAQFHQKKIRQVVICLQEIEEKLMSGLLPTTQEWERLKELPEPWGELSYHSLNELRACGGSVLPTLVRIRSLAQEQGVSLSNAYARSSQSTAQAMICSLLVPLIGAALYQMIPGVREKWIAWLVACTLALLIVGFGVIWMVRLAEVARWGGLKRGRRNWILGSLCVGEKFLALIRSGVPPDLAWIKACGILQEFSPDLKVSWGHSVWESSAAFQAAETVKSRRENYQFIQLIIEAGMAIKKAVHVSLMEGHPCLDKVESVLLALRRDVESQIEREVTLLGTRTLQPLFVCVAPALLGLLSYGLWLAAHQEGVEFF